MKCKELKLICLALILSGCAGANPKSFKDDLKNKLLALSSVSKVNDIEIEGNNEYKARYEVFFEVPVDWNNINGEKINQRVVIDANSYAIPTVVELQGYNIGDKYIDTGFTRELPTLVNGNFVVIEHRFFGKSSYSKANFESASGWEQLTVKNAAHDHNFIIGELRKIFTAKFVATGHSKGGYITNCLACLYPNTCDCYVPFVAPCLTQVDERPFDFIFNEAGNSTFGEVEGKKIRDNILKFQVFCLEHKDTLIPTLFSESYSPSSDLYRYDFLNKENIFDINVLDFSYGFWQYGYTTASRINEFVNMPEECKEELYDKQVEAINIFTEGGGSMSGTSYNNSTFPYFITAYKEMGNYDYDFTPLQEMAASLNKNISISIPKGKEHEYSVRCYLSEDQYKNVKYDITMYNTLNEWINNPNIDTKVIMINGEEDPWYHGSLVVPDTHGANIKVYTHPTHNHRVQITSFDNDTKTEILNLLNTWLR